MVDVPLDTSRANEAARLRLTFGCSTTDACVGQLALSLDGNVTVLTSDLTDLPRLVTGHPRVRVERV